MPKIYLSPAAHGHDNPCNFDSACGENIHCNLYMDELEPYLLACGFEVKRNPKERTGDRLKEAFSESNAWGADLHYVAHTNAGGGDYSKIMVYNRGTAYGYAEKLIVRRRELFDREGKSWAAKITVEPQWAELQQTVAPALYDEMVFHDNAEQIAWFHGRLREMAEATAKAICDMFGMAFVDPYAADAGVYRVYAEVAGREQAEALAQRLRGEGYAAGIEGGTESGSSEPEPEEAPALRVGATVQYSGRLYATSTGGGAGATVSGTYTVSRYLPERSHGVLLDGGLGWVRAEDCKVVG